MRETVFKECYVCHESSNYSIGCDTKSGFVCNFCVQNWLNNYIFMMSPLKRARESREEE